MQTFRARTIMALPAFPRWNTGSNAVVRAEEGMIAPAPFHTMTVIGADIIGNKNKEHLN